MSYKHQVEGSIPSAPTKQLVEPKIKFNFGTEVLAAAYLALNQVGEGSSPSGPTKKQSNFALRV